ncbi:MAG: glycosyltransferase family 4 protein [Geminicoccaceae bacterium]
MNTKRIGIPFTGESVGGSHMSTLLLLEGLDRRSFEPVVIVHREGEVTDLLKRRSVPFVVEPIAANETWKGSPHRRLVASFRAAVPVKRLIAKHRLDLIHVQDHKAFQLWIWGARLAGKPMVLHWRGPYRKTIVTRAMMRFADRILIISDYLKNRLPDELRHRAELIYNPFDTAQPRFDRDKLRSDLRAELGVAEDSVVLAWIGNLYRRKQPDQFVDIVTKLASARPSQSVHGILCGGPGDMSDDPSWIEKLKAAGDRIHVLGFRDPITPTLAAADALVVTAADEPFGRTVVEAMLAGVPVVAAEDGGYVEAVEPGGTGLLVPPSDNKAFVDAVRSLLDDPQGTEDMVAAARHAACDRFSIDRHVEAVEAAYRSSLGLAERPPSHAAKLAAE